MAESERSVSAAGTRGAARRVTAGEFELKCRRAETVAGGTNTGPQPPSCCWAPCLLLHAGRGAQRGQRQVRCAALELQVDGHLTTGRGSAAIRVVVRAAEPTGGGVGVGPRPPNGFCYVTRTLAGSPEITFVTG